MTGPRISFWGPGSSLIEVDLCSSSIRFGAGRASFRGQVVGDPVRLRQFHIPLDRLVVVSGVGPDD